MKKAFYILFCVIFFGICTVFSLGMLIPGTSEAAENTDSLPDIVSDGKINHTFGNDLESWFSENFAFRNTIVDVYSELKLNMFSEGNSQVIAGKDDFLFFDETLDCYMRNNRMSDDEIRACAETLLHVQNEAESLGAEFLFVCAPNKNTIYHEMMPDRYLRNDVMSDLDRLYEELDLLGVSYTDLRSTLSDAAADELIYHKRDSHWNGAGAKLAFEQICDRFGVTPVGLADRGPVTVNDFEGDLDALLFPGKIRYDNNTTYDFDGLYVYTSAFATPMDITITTRGGGDGKLLMYRDSFGNALIPYMASSFSEVRFERTTPYKTDLIGSFDADFVIIEIAERNLRNLALYGDDSTDAIS